MAKKSVPNLDMTMFLCLSLNSNDDNRKQEFIVKPCDESEVVFGGAIAVPLLYLRKMAMVRGQILFSALVVKAGSTVHTMHRVSMTRVSTSELNWAASWTSPSRMLGRKG